MSILSVEQVNDYLSTLRKSVQQQTLIDIHTHATEVLFDELDYGEQHPGLHYVDGTRYEAPMPGKLRLDIPRLKADQSV